MSLFYAYLKDDQGDSYRYLLTFVNREAADEWWRMFYTWQYSGHDLIRFFSNGGLPDAKQFYRKMFITQVSYCDGKNPTAILPTEVTDHISGKWYFIRSKADPWSHWYFRTDGSCLVCGGADCDAVHVSSEYRTKFCIKVRDQIDSGAQVPENFVMIGKDEISIAAPKGYTVHINEVGDLKATEGYRGDIDLLFNDLKKRFITRAEKQVNGEVWEYAVPVERGMGEAWELAD